VESGDRLSGLLCPEAGLQHPIIRKN